MSGLELTILTPVQMCGLEVHDGQYNFFFLQLHVPLFFSISGMAEHEVNPVYQHSLHCSPVIMDSSLQLFHVRYVISLFFMDLVKGEVHPELKLILIKGEQ